MTKNNEKLKDLDKTYIEVLLEKSRLNRSIADLAFKKSMWLYFGLLLFGILGLTFEIVSKNLFFILVFMGLGVLIVGSVPYVLTMLTERKRMNLILFNMMIKDDSLKDYNHENYVFLRKRSEKNVK